MGRRQVISALVLAAAAAVTLPAGADAQRPEGERRPMGAQGGEAPVERIVELRQELGLTDAQVTELQRIQAELRERNAPLRERLSEARERMHAEREAMTEEERREMRERMRARREAGEAGRRGPAGVPPAMSAELRPVMEEIRTNTRNAREQIRAVLTTEQREKLRELRPAPRARRGPPAI